MRAHHWGYRTIAALPGALAAALLLAGAGAASAVAAPAGTLVQLPPPNNCVSQSSTLASDPFEGCGVTSGHGLFGAGAVAVSPDGTSVYVAAGNSFSGQLQSNTVVTFHRDPSTGAVSETSCIGEGTSECETKTAGLVSADDVVVSPDGTRVYVASDNSGVTVFKRAPDGSLTPAGCLRDPSDSVDSSCTPASGFLAGGARGLAVSSDSKFVYAATQGGNAIAEFQRTAGSLSYLDCVSGDAGANPACTAHSYVGLLGVTALALSPTGDRLYAVSYAGNSLDVFARNTTTGLLTGEVGCVSLVTGASGEAGCASTTVPGMSSTEGVAVSADGTHVYTASLDGAVASFATKTAAPGITPLGCIGAAPPASPTPGCSSNAGIGLQGAEKIVLAPGAGPGTIAAYVAGFFDGAVSELEIDPSTGALKPPDACITGGAMNETCTGARAAGLVDAEGLAVSPDANNVYVASRGIGKERPGCGGTCSDTVSALAAFSRFAAPAVQTSAPTAVSATTATLQGEVNPNGTDATYHFELSTDPGFTSPTSLPAAGADAGSGTASVPVTTTATGLAPHTTYYVHLVASNRGGQATSSPAQQFETLSAPTTTTTATVGDQQLTLVTPGACVSGTLTASLTSKTLKGKGPKLKFVVARLYIDKGIRHNHRRRKPTFSPNRTVRHLPATMNLSLKGVKPGDHTLKVVASFRKTTTHKRVSKTLKSRFTVC